MAKPAKNGTWTPRRLREHLQFEVSDWAKILNVGVITVRRWEEEGRVPSGLAAGVFTGIGTALDAGVPPSEIHNRIALGLGAFIAYGLTPKGIRR